MAHEHTYEKTDPTGVLTCTGCGDWFVPLDPVLEAEMAAAPSGE